MYAVKKELKLNNVETSLMRGCSGFKRFVFNYGLKLLQASWDWADVKASDTKRLNEIKKVFTQVTMQQPENAWMKSYPSTIYQSAFIDLKDAISRWRKGVSDFPQMKSKKRGDSFTVYKSSGVYPEKGKPVLPFTNRQLIEAGKIIRLPGLKSFRLKEPITFTCSSQTFTVSRTADRWFVAFNLDAEKLSPIIHPLAIVGVDLGVKTLATCSDGTSYDMPVSTKQAKTKLAKIQWRNRNKSKGDKRLKLKASQNAKKFYLKLARQHATIANIRLNTIHQMTTDLSRKAYTVRIEDLNVSGMIANHKLAYAVTNQCFYEIRRQLVYKQAHYGTKVELVDRWFPSSKTCSHCGHIQPMPLNQRVFKCGRCEKQIDRDLNASINLENAPKDRVRLA